jgi:hypothetical protein
MRSRAAIEGGVCVDDEGEADERVRTGQEERSTSGVSVPLAMLETVLFWNIDRGVFESSESRVRSAWVRLAFSVIVAIVLLG